MNCYNHEGIQAVGLCKHCNKGLCRDCQIDTGAGLACSESCVDEVNDINRMMGASSKMISRGLPNIHTIGIFYYSIGLVFAIYGFNKGGFTYFATIIGIIFLCMGVYQTVGFLRNRKKDT